MVPPGLLRRAAVLALVASAAALKASDDPRPSLDEWKAGTAADDSATAAVADRDSKTSAVNKVTHMLESLQSQVTDEGEKEAETYNKFACFCKDTTADKTEAIEAGKDAESTLSSSIAALSKERDDLDARIAGLAEDIDAAQKAISAASDKRAAELADFETNAADLTAALTALRGAIDVMKSSQSPSLMQLDNVRKTVSTAVLLADALGLVKESQRQVVALLQQAPDVPHEDYNFHSGDIIKTLETLLTSFQKTKATIDAEEVKAIAAHDAFLQEQSDLLKQKTAQLEDANKSKSEKQAEIASLTQRLSTVSATLLDDQQYLAELSQLCSERAITWDQRSKIRQDELSALTAAIGIIKSTVTEKTSAATVRLVQQGVGIRLAEAIAINPAAMEAVEAEAEAVDARVAAPSSFLQRRLLRRGPSAGGREAVISLLRSQGVALKSAILTSLASRIAADPLAKVKQLIQELIERLLQEASNEENHKGWCDKSIADAEQKRTYAAEAVERLNGNMAELEATRNTLDEEIAVLNSEIADLNARKAEAEALRAAEKAENAATVKEAEEGLNAVQQAIDILDKFYKTAAKATVPLALAQQSPASDVPDTGFKAGEAYTGSQGASTGILGVLDVIETDFRRTMEATEKAEATAEQEHLAFTTETEKSLAEKSVAAESKTRQRDDAAEELAAASESFSSQSEILDSAIKELLTLQPACVNTGMSYEERVARRKDEMESLRKALCVLDNYGPGGAQGEC